MGKKHLRIAIDAMAKNAQDAALQRRNTLYPEHSWDVLSSVEIKETAMPTRSWLVTFAYVSDKGVICEHDLVMLGKRADVFIVVPIHPTHSIGFMEYGEDDKGQDTGNHPTVYAHRDRGN